MGTLYAPDDVRRDAGYSIYYMGINTGAFIAPLITGWLAQSDGFRGHARRRSASAPNTLLALGLRRGGGGHVLRPDPVLARREAPLARRGFGPSGRATPWPRPESTARCGWWASSRGRAGRGHRARGRPASCRSTPDAIASNFKWVLLGITVAFFAWLFLSGEWTPDERKRLVVITVLFVAASVFWMAYEQAGSTLNLFAQRSVDNSVLGHAFPASWYQSLPPLFIILFAPVFAVIWLRLGTPEPLEPRQVHHRASCSLAIAFALMIGAASAAAGGARVSPMWLVLSYLFQVLGELCLSPVGLSAMSRLAPARVAGLVMGVWFLAIGGGELSWRGWRRASTRPCRSPTLFGLVTAIAAGGCGGARAADQADPTDAGALRA